MDECNVYILYKQISTISQIDRGNKNSLHCLKRREGLFSLRLILSAVTEPRLLLFVSCNNIDMAMINELHVLWFTITSLTLKVIYSLNYKLSESYLSGALSRMDGKGGRPTSSTWSSFFRIT